LQDAFCVLQDLVVPKSQNSKSSLFKIPGALGVQKTLILVSVTTAINLDNQHRLTATEIHDVRTDRTLSPKLRILQTASTQVLPETKFGGRRPTAQVSRMIKSVGKTGRVPMSHPLTPSLSRGERG
jgi:hypothetical protein